MTPASRRRRRIGGSGLDHECRRLLDELFDPDEESDGFAAVDDAVIVCEGRVHHGAKNDLTAHANRTLLDRVQAEDANLRWVEDRRAHERSKDAAVRDAERATAQVFERQSPVVGLSCELPDANLDGGE